MAETTIDRIHRMFKRCPQCDARLDRNNRILCEKCERESELIQEALD